MVQVSLWFYSLLYPHVVDYSPHYRRRSCLVYMEQLQRKKVTLFALLTQQGVAVEHSGAAGLALLLQAQHDIPKEDRILIVSTGKTKRRDHA